MKYPCIDVRVYYKPNDKVGTSFDDTLLKLARKYGGGRGGGSGYCFVNGMRDIDFGFKDIRHAQKFFNHVQRFKNIDHVKSQSYLGKKDYE